MKLHLGCGKRNFGEEWIHIDASSFPHIKYNNIVSLPFENNSVDIIYASHVISYFDRQEIIDVLKEWNRVLKTNGILRLAMPDFESMAKLYVNKNIDLNFFLGPLYGKMVSGDKTIYHKTTYDLNSIRNIVNQCGFTNVKLYDWRNTEHGNIDDHSQAYIPHMDKDNGTLISLNIECNKI